MTDLAVSHDELRPLMFSIAYRMLGSVAEAEDVVQEAFLRMHRSADATIANVDAYATTVTTRLAIDALRSARNRRETYVGPWLPEPLLADQPDPAVRVEQDESVSVAMLTLMEALTPVERAVFILREVLSYDYRDIAVVVERSEAHCRQLFARARKHLAAGRPRFEPSLERRDELAAAFLDAVGSGSMERLEALLAEDVVFYGDGGGKAPAIRKPMSGAIQVARFLLSLARRGRQVGVLLEPAVANGQPALVTRAASGELLGVMSVDFSDGRVVALRNQINPDKLQHLGPVGDLNSLVWEWTR
jgi:RNA polymerase sigma-70 factor (TIGR02957 family)